MSYMTTTQASISLCSILFAYLAPHNALAFATGGSSAIHKIPIIQEKSPEAEIELPDLQLLFDRVCVASPLARLVMEGDYSTAGKCVGFDAIDEAQQNPELKWRKVEANKRKTVHRIDKADRFQNLKTPLLRFRSSIKGPCIGERFSHMIVVSSDAYLLISVFYIQSHGQIIIISQPIFMQDLEEREKWDDQVANVNEMYPIQDLGTINSILGNHSKYGTCTRLGVGYTLTKQGILSPREQLTLSGMQQYPNGATILWGTEMEEHHNHLLPEGRSRHTRAKSHLFAVTLVPTGPDSFDVEYLLQMDVGGGIPNFLTTPALTDAVKKLFEHAKIYFEGGDGSELDMYLKSQQEEVECSEIEILSGGSTEDDYSLDAGIDLNEEHSNHDAVNDIKSLLFTP
mmetsp:Transcript_8234/g.15036  ORF Transcript_8234/g.15036 Transcript_8234/m.15036 type:complete len:399 (-) Transcript_8234:95-1291(-)